MWTRSRLPPLVPPTILSSCALVHRLIGGSTTVGATVVTTICSELESAAISQQDSHIFTLVSHLKDAFAKHNRKAAGEAQEKARESIFAS